MSDKQVERLKELCKKIWSLLTNDERDTFYYGSGVIGFVEEIAYMLGLDVSDENEELWLNIADDLIK
jgi:hypothetical protein